MQRTKTIEYTLDQLVEMSRVELDCLKYHGRMTKFDEKNMTYQYIVTEEYYNLVNEK